MKTPIFFVILYSGFVLLSCQSNGVFQQNDRLLFIGDSITFQGGYVERVKNYLAQEKADLNLSIANAGISSETVSGLSEPIHNPVRPHLFDRLDSILETHQPDCAFFLYGINDGIYHPFSEARLQAYKDGITQFLDEMECQNIKVILLTPPPFAVNDQQKEALKAKQPESYSYKHPYYDYDEAVMQPFRDYILAVRHPAVAKIVDIYAVLDQNRAVAYDDDPIHPNAKGHELMAKAIVEVIFE
ncbi:MAG: SGNH/GDSL hydrolase family protein [Bacteroidota bacterium]